MGLETGTWISDLVISNPATSDLESQGANHLQLIKTVLQNSFPGANKAFPIPTMVAKSANYTVVKADYNKTFLVTTTGGSVTLTLPTLASGDAGWEISLVKVTNESNPVFVAPASGSIQSGELSGLSQCRRCVPGIRSIVFWTGTAWIAERALRVPVGTVLEYQGGTLPVGYEWPSGQTLTSAATNYPEYSAINGSGVTPDRRGRFGLGKGNMGGSDAARVTVAGGNFDSTGLNATQDNQNWVLTQAQLPAFKPTLTTTITDTRTWQVADLAAGNYAAGGGKTALSSDFGGNTAVTVASGTISGGTVFAANLGSGNSHPNVPPAIVMNFILVTE